MSENEQSFAKSKVKQPAESAAKQSSSQETADLMTFCNIFYQRG
jgi:hypothetical protein